MSVADNDSRSSMPLIVNAPASRASLRGESQEMFLSLLSF
jgi:hypothetical protein